MKDIVFYNKNECSIKGFENNFSDKISLIEIIRNTMKVSDAIVLDAWNKNCPIEKSIDSLSKISSGMEYLRIKDNDLLITFSYKKQARNHHVMEAIANIWFEYERVSFFFLVGDIDLNARIEHLFKKEFSRLGSNYFFCRAVEDDVLWIEKSDDLSFDDILESWGGERRYL